MITTLSKHRNKIIGLILFIIAIITLAMVPKDDFPFDKPNIKITYDNEKVSTINGEFNWFNKELGGNSTFAEPLENLNKPIYAEGGETLQIKFSKEPDSVAIQEISNIPYTDYEYLNGYSKKEYSFILPKEKGEYHFQVRGVWDETHNIAEIFKVCIE